MRWKKRKKRKQERRQPRATPKTTTVVAEFPVLAIEALPNDRRDVRQQGHHRHIGRIVPVRHDTADAVATNGLAIHDQRDEEA